MIRPEPLTADLLLEHSGFLHGLARRLVLDEQRAEDVVQEAWLAALRRPPPASVGLRAWLASVTRNLALRTRRTEGRLRRREAHAARAESTAPTADVAARVEIQSRIADAVARLNEPGRSAIVWRYFDGLMPREIARNEQVSLRTIESRLRRAREALRRELDEGHGGSRSAWCALLAPTLGLDPLTLSSSSAAGVTAASSTSATASTAGVLTAAAVGATIVSTQLIVGVAAACVAGAFFAGRQFPASPETELVNNTAESASTDRGGPLLGVPAENADPSGRQLAKARQENDELARTNLTLRKELEALKSAAPLARGATTASEDAELTEVFAPEKYKSTVAEVSWPEAGEAAARIVPLLGDLAAAFLRGEGVDQALGIKIFKQNQKLQTVAVTAIGAKVPGAGENGAFTHPIVTLNLIAAALDQAELPLDKRQRERLAEIGDRFIEDDERTKAGYSEETFRLQKTIDECALKDRMFADIDGLLRGEQRDVLHPEAIRDRMGIDIYSSGTIWYGVSKALSFETREDLAEGLVKRFNPGGETTEEELALIRAAAKEWAESFSETYLQASADPIAQISQREAGGGRLAGWQKVEQARVAAHHQVALYRTLVDSLPQGSDKAEKLRDSGRVLIPLRASTK